MDYKQLKRIVQNDIHSRVIFKEWGKWGVNIAEIMRYTDPYQQRIRDIFFFGSSCHIPQYATEKFLWWKYRGQCITKPSDIDIGIFGNFKKEHEEKGMLKYGVLHMDDYGATTWWTSMVKIDGLHFFFLKDMNSIPENEHDYSISLFGNFCGKFMRGNWSTDSDFIITHK